MPVPSPRPAVASLPVYKPGKSAEVAMREHDLTSAVKLASNENPYDPLPSVLQAIEATAAATLGRYADHRATTVRAALADRYGLTAEEVAVGCGSVGLLQQVLLTYCDPGDEVLYGWRSFEAYPIYTKVVGGTAVTVPNRREALDMDGVLAGISERTRVVFVTSPNNPTGTAVRHEELATLLAAVPPDAVVVLDEAYHEYVTGTHVPRALELLAEHPNLVVLRTFSKAYGLAALRVGYLLAHPEIVAAVDRTLVPFAVNGLGQAAALASLEADDEMGDRVNLTILERERVAGALRSLGLSVPDPQANFVWLPAGGATEALVMKMEGMGVVTRPFPGEGLRVTTGTRAENDRFLDALDACIEPLELSAHWLLPTGDLARRVQGYVDRIDVAQERLVEHAVRDHHGLTPPDGEGPTAGEQWTADHLWGHLGELAGYWHDELARVLGGATTFGRTKADEQRRAAVAAGPSRPVGDHLVAAQRALDALRATLAGLSSAEWATTSGHPTLGAMDVPAFLERFAVGHVEEHLDQLDALAG